MVQGWRHLRTRPAWVDGLTLVAVAVVVSLVAKAAAPSPTDSCLPGVPVPLEVIRGRAIVSLPTSEPSDRYLLVVSALSRVPGRFPVRIEAREATHPSLPRSLVQDKSIRPFRLSRRSAETPPLSTLLPPGERQFWLPAREGDVALPSNHIPIRGVLRDHGDRVAVYVDANDALRVSGETLRDIVATFDDHITPLALAQTGLARDQDGDGRFTILLTSWLGHLADGRLAVDGFVCGADFLDETAPPLGNRCDMMYLNANLESGSHLRTVIAHEYAHAVTFSHKVHRRGDADEEGWLDEAIAHVAEDGHAFSRSNLDYRVDAFLAHPEHYRLLVADYSPPNLIRSHGHRGSAYLFLRWCVDQYGPDLIRSLIESDLRGVANLEAATGRSFASLYRDWSLAMALDGARNYETPQHALLIPGSRTSIVLDGTTTHYALVEGSRTGAVKVVVSGPPGADLQVTAVRMPKHPHGSS